MLNILADKEHGIFYCILNSIVDSTFSVNSKLFGLLRHPSCWQQSRSLFLIIKSKINYFLFTRQNNSSFTAFLIYLDDILLTKWFDLKIVYYNNFALKISFQNCYLHVTKKICDLMFCRIRTHSQVLVQTKFQWSNT